MKKCLPILSLTLMFAVLSVGAAQKQQTAKLPPSPIDGAAWKQTFGDEFEGPAIDPNEWNVRHEGRTCRKNNFWHRDCAKLDGKGHLRVITRRSTDRPDWHDTACIETRKKFAQRFGYFEIRAKMQSQPGFWTAFWAMPAVEGAINSTKNQGMDGTELDIFEKNTLDNAVQHALHWDGYGKDHKSRGHCADVPGVMKGFHTFGLLWTPDEYVFYVDGKQTWRTKAGGVSQVPVYLKVSSEKGKWAGNINKASLPDEMRVDYVRAYQLYTTDGKEAFRPKDLPENTNKASRRKKN
jgi:beta-glucanase (GH16 family)